MGRELEDPEMVREFQVKTNANGYEGTAFSATLKKFKINKSELTYLWMFQPSHPVTIKTRAYYYSILEKEKSGFVPEFWSPSTSV
jgi:hypothetical protein